MIELRTERLLLRGWRDTDLDPWAALNADPQVREFLGGPLTREESAAAMARFRATIQARGWGWWAVEVVETGAFIGFTGLDPVEPGLPVSGVEIGWRLSRETWGHGYATEAARAVIQRGFGAGVPEVYAVVRPGNVASMAVCARLGMQPLGRLRRWYDVELEAFRLMAPVVVE